MKIERVQIGIAIAWHGEEKGSAEQNQTTCSATAKKPVNSADFIM
jgi:hypothetical protein